MKQQKSRTQHQPSGNKPGTALNRLFVRGHQKVHYKKANGDLMMLFSDNEHKRIAQLIAHWLTQDDNTPR